MDIAEALEPEDNRIHLGGVSSLASQGHYQQ